jgi:hypothetical protein
VSTNLLGEGAPQKEQPHQGVFLPQASSKGLIGPRLEHRSAPDEYQGGARWRYI